MGVQRQVQDEHYVPRHTAHCFYLHVHGSTCWDYNLGPGLQDRQVQETEGGRRKNKKLEEEETITESAGWQEKKEREEEKQEKNRSVSGSNETHVCNQLLFYSPTGDVQPHIRW